MEDPLSHWLSYINEKLGSMQTALEQSVVDRRERISAALLAADLTVGMTAPESELVRRALRLTDLLLVELDKPTQSAEKVGA